MSSASATFLFTDIEGSTQLLKSRRTEYDPRTNRVTRISLPYLPSRVAADADDVWVTVRAG